MAQQCENCDRFLKPEKDGTCGRYCPGCEDLIEWLKEERVVDRHFAAEPAQERERVPAAKVKVRDAECSD